MTDFDDIAKSIIKEIADEWQAQGHDLTGKFREGMSYKVTTTGSITKIEIFDTTDSGYGKILDSGVKAENIPFYPGSGRKSSEYINGLTRYAKLRMGASDKDAISIAFAIAHKHKKEGMPLPSTSQYSKTGRRTKFVDDAAKRFDKIIQEKIKWQ